MQIERLSALCFRNLAELRIEPHPRFTILEGDNGQGKTNVLEAIAVLATLRSFRAGRLGECVAFGAEKAQIGCRVHGRGAHLDLGVEIAGNRSRVFVDGKAVRRSSEALGALAAVVFTSADLLLPHGEPAARRRWLDRAIFQHRPAYLGELHRYDKAVASRNALLRDADAPGFDLRALDAYDGLLAQAGARISAARDAFCGELSRRVSEEFGAFAAPGLHAALRYDAHDPGIEPGQDAAAREAALLRRLGERRRLDLRRGTTSVGPHRDDIGMLLDGRSAREHASQGQSRALVLATKIAEIRSLEAVLGEPPLLLMDDVSSELDRARNAALMHHLDAFGGQVFLTTTDASYIQLTAPRGVWRVGTGRLTPSLALERIG